MAGDGGRDTGTLGGGLMRDRVIGKQSGIPRSGPSKVTSFPRSLSPRRRGAGIQFLPDIDPRFRGG